MTPLSQRLTFSLANTAAVLVALYIGFARDLERPYWAMFTVFIIAKPISGAVRSKGVYRFLGTCVGAAMAVFLIPPLVQEPVLLCLAMSAWVGLCLYVSLLDRTPRSYALLLTGYTATIVGLAVVDTPNTIFDTAVARVEEISLGILCGSIAHSIFFPRNIAHELNDRISEIIKGCSEWIARSLRRPDSPVAPPAQLKLEQVVTDLHVLYTHVAFETSDVPRSGHVMRCLQDRLAVLLPRATAVQAAVRNLETHGKLRPPIIELLESASRWALSVAGTGPVQTPLVRHQIAAELTERRADLDWQTLLEKTVLLSLGQLIDALEDCRLLADTLRDPQSRLSPHLQRDVAQPGVRLLTRDRGLALLSACAAAIATLIGCVLWIQGSWPEGAVAAQFAAIGCSLFATFDNPAKVVGSAAAAIALVLPLAALYQFAIIPRIDGFPSLALVLFPVLMLFSFMQTFEKLEGAAVVLAVGFAGALALQSSYRADFAAFINSNTAEILGLLIAAVTNVLFRTIDPIWNALRISRAGWRSVRQLARTPGSVITEQWTMQMFDRMGLVTARLANASVDFVKARHVDGLRDLRVGLNVAAIRNSQYRGAARPELDRALDKVADAYASLERGNAGGWGAGNPSSADDAGVREAIDASIRALSASWPARQPLGLLAALTSLRLDLAPAALPYSSAPTAPAA